MPPTDEPRVWRAARVIGRRVHGAMVLVRLPSLDTRVLNEVGARVWELADGRTIGAITSALEDELGAPRARVEDDVRAFVASLVEEALLRLER